MLSGEIRRDAEAGSPALQGAEGVQAGKARRMGADQVELTAFVLARVELLQGPEESLPLGVSGPLVPEEHVREGPVRVPEANDPRARSPVELEPHERPDVLGPHRPPRTLR